MRKVCRGCKKRKPLAAFRKQLAGLHGHTSRCRPCVLADVRSWTRRNYHEAWSYATLRNHRTRGVTFAFTVKQLTTFVKRLTKCNVCDKKLGWQPGRMSDDSPTIDRIDNRRGRLNFSDIQILCIECNTTKGRRTMSQFISYCRTVAYKYA